MTAEYQLQQLQSVAIIHRFTYNLRSESTLNVLLNNDIIYCSGDCATKHNERINQNQIKSKLDARAMQSDRTIAQATE